MTNFSSLQLSYPTALDPGLRFDHSWAMSPIVAERIFKVSLLTSECISIPVSNIIAEPVLADSLAFGYLRDVYRTKKIQDKSPLVISYAKDRQSISQSIERMLETRVYFGMLTEQENDALKKNNIVKAPDFYNFLQTSDREDLIRLAHSLKELDQQFSDNEINYGVDMTSGKYRELVEDASDVNTLDQAYQDHSKFENDTTFKKYLELKEIFRQRIQTEDKFSRSKGLKILKTICTERKDLEAVRVGCHHECLNNTWLENIRDSDDIDIILQGQIMKSSLAGIYGKALNHFSEPVNSTEIEQNMGQVLNLSSMEIIDEIRPSDIIRLRKDNDFRKSLRNVANSSNSEKPRLLANHIENIFAKIAEDEIIHPKTSLNEGGIFRPSHNLSKVLFGTSIASAGYGLQQMLFESNFTPDGIIGVIPPAVLAFAGIMGITVQGLSMKSISSNKFRWFSSLTKYANK